MAGFNWLKPSESEEVQAMNANAPFSNALNALGIPGFDPENGAVRDFLKGSAAQGIIPVPAAAGRNAVVSGVQQAAKQLPQLFRSSAPAGGSGTPTIPRILESLKGGTGKNLKPYTHRGKVESKTGEVGFPKTRGNTYEGSTVGAGGSPPAGGSNALAENRRCIAWHWTTW